MYLLVLLSGLFFTLCSGQQEFPNCHLFPNGTLLPHPNCRMYYECQNNVASEKTCPDSPEQLYFDDVLGSCNYLVAVDCSDRVCPRNFVSVEYSVSIHNIGGKFGTWMKDQWLQGTGTKVWVMHGTNSNSLDEYASEYDFQTNNLLRTITLPYSCEGTGHVVYQDSFYCQVYASRYMGKYELTSGLYTWVELPTLGQSLYDEYQWGYLNDVSGTAWGNGSYVDFAVDEYGLWVIHSDISNQHNIIITRVDVNLNVIATYNTNFSKVEAGNSFMICGRLYVINSCIGESTYIRYIYDTSDQSETNLLPTTIPFPSFQRSCSVGDTCPTYTNSFITGLDFAVAEKPDPVLYAWNCQYQEAYKPIFN